MSEQFSDPTSKPITRQRAESAAQWLVDNAVSIARSKAERDKSEHMLKHFKAIAMKASKETSAAAQEREALASDTYLTAIDQAFDATVKHETLLATQRAAATVIDVWRSINSSLRGTS